MDVKPPGTPLPMTRYLIPFGSLYLAMPLLFITSLSAQLFGRYAGHHLVSGILAFRGNLRYFELQMSH